MRENLAAYRAAQPEPGYLDTSFHELAMQALRDTGLDREQVDQAVLALAAKGLLVGSTYYVPADGELLSMYTKLGEAHLRGVIRVRWVMCAETFDALVARHRNRRYAHWRMYDEFSTELTENVGWVLEVDTSGQPGRAGTLFGVDIRLDPAARRPMFEMDPA